MRVPLIGGMYKTDSIIANAQRCINLYPESNAEFSQSPVQVTTYLTPGLTLLMTGPEEAPVRCNYLSSKGELYSVIGSTIYYISPSWNAQKIGVISSGTTPVSMVDNGSVIVVVDGTPNGYAIDMVSRRFGHIVSDAFYGADRVDYVDTYFIFNRPGTNQFYISLSQVNYTMLTDGSAFDSLDIAAKTGYPDPLSGLIVMHRELWLIGTLKTEIWYNSGSADFTFQPIPGAFVEHGCAATHSIAAQDLFTYWLSEDLQGQRIVVEGNAYQAKRISTYAIEAELAKYGTVSDAIGFTYQQKGHTFYVLIFPSANKSWAYDISTGLWHERCYTDDEGNLNRIRANCCAAAYGKIVVGDWENGNLYALDTEAYTDNGQPISRIRAFPHVVDELERVYYTNFIADMEVGNNDGSVDGSTFLNPPVVSLQWSDNRGVSYGTKIQQSLGDAGRYLTVLQWNRLGYARDRVFELSWSAPCKTALQGAFIQMIKGQS